MKMTNKLILQYACGIALFSFAAVAVHEFAHQLFLASFGKSTYVIYDSGSFAVCMQSGISLADVPYQLGSCIGGYAAAAFLLPFAWKNPIYSLGVYEEMIYGTLEPLYMWGLASHVVISIVSGVLGFALYVITIVPFVRRHFR